MILVDTDHATFLKYPESERGRRLIERLTRAAQADVVAVAIVTIEERMRGWLAVIAKERTALRQVPGYRELATSSSRLGFSCIASVPTRNGP